MQPSIDINPPENLSKFYFDLQLINDIGVHLIISETDEANVTVAIEGTLKIKNECIICRKNVVHQEMRAHIGGHILRGEVEGSNVCGFCGRDICTIELQATSKKGSNKFFRIGKQDCAYFFHYGRKASSSKRNPCTNRVINCPLGNRTSTIWTYNAKFHYNVKHPGVEIPILIEKKEIDTVRRI